MLPGAPPGVVVPGRHGDALDRPGTNLCLPRVLHGRPQHRGWVRCRGLDRIHLLLPTVRLPSRRVEDGT